jgi:hypothetical protein
MLPVRKAVKDLFPTLNCLSIYSQQQHNWLIMVRLISDGGDGGGAAACFGLGIQGWLWGYSYKVQMDPSPMR